MTQRRYHRFQIAYTRPFDFDRSLKSLRWRGADGVEWVRGGRYRRLFNLNDKPILVEVRIRKRSSAALLKGEILYPAGGVGYRALTEVRRSIHRILFTELDLKPFERFTRKQLPRVYSDHIRPARGLKPVGHPMLYETLVWGIVGQQVNTRFALELKRRLAEQFGTRLQFDGETYLAFPSVDRMARVAYRRLRPLQFSQRKAEYTIDLARRLATGQWSEQEIGDRTDEEVHNWLVSIRGIGEATAALAMIVGLGRFSRVPLGDLGLQKALQEIHRLPKRPGPTPRPCG